MKIAFPTNNLKTLSNHTALSKFIAIICVENGQITERIAVKNPIPQMASGISTSEEQGRGLGAGRIIPQILSNYHVDVFVAREIGEGMRSNLEYAGIRVIVTDEKEIEKILEEIGGLQ